MHNGGVHHKAAALLLLSALLIVTGCSSSITSIVPPITTTITSIVPPITTTVTSTVPPLTSTATSILYQTKTMTTTLPPSTINITVPTLVYPSTVYPSLSFARIQVISQDYAVAGATVSVTINNPFSVSVKFTVVLRIDGVETQRTEISVQSSQVVSFNVDKDISVFTFKTENYSVIIDATSDAKLPNGYLLEKKLDITTPMANNYEITYISDGLRVKGYLALPNTPGSHPAIIFCRGGNKNYGVLTGYETLHYAQLLGYVAVGSQYRGNAGGQGQDQFGGDDVNDVVNLIPLLKSLPEVDSSRIGIVGVSRGGMMAYETLRKQTLAGTNDIKAAVIVSGAADLFFESINQSDMLNGVFIPLIGGTPAQLPKEYEARSAVRWANDINVPILIQHGDRDVEVDIYEANEMAAELQRYGKTYKYIIYPGRGHDLFGAGNQSWTDGADWLKTYLK